MICYICRCICDPTDDMICVVCREKRNRNAERCYHLSLLKECLPWIHDRHLKQKIEIQLGKIPPFIKVEPFKSP